MWPSVAYSYADAGRIITMRQWRRATQFFRKIYLSFNWKGCVWEGVGDGAELQYIEAHSYGHQRFFPVLLGCSMRGLGAQPLWDMFLIPASSLQLRLLNRESWEPPLFGAGFLYRIFSPTGLISNCSIGDPEGPLCWVLFFSTTSYPQLIELPVHWVI